MISPRYCSEDIEYLKIDGIKKMAYPMRCFCDISLPTLDEYRQLVENIDLWELHDEKYDILSKIIVWERSRGDF